MSENFNYSYSAERQAEVEAIRKKYLPKEEQEDKMAELRKLDASVGTPGLIASLALGVVSALIFGVGMCCFLVWNLWALGAVACRARDPAADRGTEPKMRKNRSCSKWIGFFISL